MGTPLAPNRPMKVPMMREMQGRHALDLHPSVPKDRPPLRPSPLPMTPLLTTRRCNLNCGVVHWGGDEAGHRKLWKCEGHAWADLTYRHAHVMSMTETIVKNSPVGSQTTKSLVGEHLHYHRRCHQRSHRRHCHQHRSKRNVQLQTSPQQQPSYSRTKLKHHLAQKVQQQLHMDRNAVTTTKCLVLLHVAEGSHRIPKVAHGIVVANQDSSQIASRTNDCVKCKTQCGLVEHQEYRSHPSRNRITIRAAMSVLFS